MNLFSRIVKAILFLCAISILSSCASVNSASITSIPSNRNKQVRAETSKTVFLAFNFDNDYVDKLTDNLKQQCPNGVVTGILTKHETIGYVLVFTHKITATGYCNMSVAKQATGKRTTASVVNSPEAQLPEVEAENQ